MSFTGGRIYKKYPTWIEGKINCNTITLTASRFLAKFCQLPLGSRLGFFTTCCPPPPSPPPPPPDSFGMLWPKETFERHSELVTCFYSDGWWWYLSPFWVIISNNKASLRYIYPEGHNTPGENKLFYPCSVLVVNMLMHTRISIYIILYIFNTLPCYLSFCIFWRWNFYA